MLDNKENYLLLKTKENRQFLTYEKESNSILEFAKSFGAEVFLVRLNSGKVLQLKKLANAICDPEFDLDADYTIIEKLFPISRKTRDSIIEDAKKIRLFIEKKLRDGKPVSLKELKEKYKDFDVTDACLCNHFTQVRKLLAKQGHNINKIGAGNYCVSKN